MSNQAACTHRCHKIMTGPYKHCGGSNFVFSICYSMSVQSAGTCVYTLYCNNPESWIISLHCCKNLNSYMIVFTTEEMCSSFCSTEWLQWVYPEYLADLYGTTSSVKRITVSLLGGIRSHAYRVS